MGRVIYKYHLHEAAMFFGEAVVPEGTVVLVAEQNGLLTAWIEHVKNTKHRMTLQIVPTGQEFNDDKLYKHVGSSKVDDFVWHVYRLRV